MGKRKRRARSNPIRVWAKRIGSGVATGLKVSPVLIGIPAAVKEQMAGGDGISKYVIETTGVDPQAGMTQDANRIAQAWVRNFILFGSGVALSFFVRRA